MDHLERIKAGWPEDIQELGRLLSVAVQTPEGEIVVLRPIPDVVNEEWYKRAATLKFYFHDHQRSLPTSQHCDCSAFRRFIDSIRDGRIRIDLPVDGIQVPRQTVGGQLSLLPTHPPPGKPED